MCQMCNQILIYPTIFAAISASIFNRYYHIQSLTIIGLSHIFSTEYEQNYWQESGNHRNFSLD
jgi:hypothetical protein